MEKSESYIQNEIRQALVPYGMFFRVNVGQAWTGSSYERLPNGDMIIRNARPFKTGLPAGFSDIFGAVPLTIKPKHVGLKVAQFATLEVKRPGGRLSENQKNFLDAVHTIGGIAKKIDDPSQVHDVCTRFHLD